MHNPEYVLIVASSGRMLAQAAQRAGYKPFVIDLYADRDTRAVAQVCYPIASLSIADVEPTLKTLLTDYPIAHIIYGSGFEDHPESLGYLSNFLVLWGNSPNVFSQALNKKSFFATLADLSIPYPTVSYTEPQDNSATWLVKPLQGHGGVGIRYFHQTSSYPTSVYWQQYIKGTAHSVLFLANGENAQIIGFNSQWSIQSGQDHFIFSGIINDGNVSDEHKATVTQWLAKIVRVFALKGLNSLDFICTANNAYLLEINARPPASMQLYDDALFIRHIEACQGKLTDTASNTYSYKAYQIIYAEYDIQIPMDFAWPSWCMDLPNDGALIHTKQPVCSIIASHKQSQQLMQQLVIKRQMIIDQLDKGIRHGI